MTIELTPEQEASLEQVARLSGRSAGAVLTEAALWFVHLEGTQDEALSLSIEQADRGEFIEEEEMDRRLSRLLAPR